MFINIKQPTFKIGIARFRYRHYNFISLIPSIQLIHKTFKWTIPLRIMKTGLLPEVCVSLKFHRLLPLKNLCSWVCWPETSLLSPIFPNMSFSSCVWKGFSLPFCSESSDFYTVPILRPGFITVFISSEVAYLQS